MESNKFSTRLADIIAEFIGSWTFVIILSTILIGWVIINIDGIANFDPYPFILLNLFLSFQAAYATPLILMSGNRQASRDREVLMRDEQLDKETNILIKQVSNDIKLNKREIKILLEARKDHTEIKNLIKELKTLIKTLKE